MHHSLLLLQDFQQDNSSPKTPTATHNVAVPSWHAPPHNVYKLNQDAVVDKIHCKVRTRAIILD